EHQDRQAREPQGEGDRHAQQEEHQEAAEEDDRRDSGRERGGHHGAIRPVTVRNASQNDSARNAIQVAPETGQAMKMNVIGSSASSELWFQPKRTNCTPQPRNTSAKASTNTLVTICRTAAGRGRSSGHTSTMKCVPSRTPTIEPSMIIQMKRKRESSSVQIHE